MREPIIVGVLALGAFVAGVVYLEHDSADQRSAPVHAAPAKTVGAGPAMPLAGAPHGPVPGGTPAAPRDTHSKQLPSDPRLAALMVSPDNGLIEFVRGSDGKVITEIDKDPSSPGFRKPTREYMYSGDKVIGLTEYRYLPDHLEISRTNVSYKPDGTLDRYGESTSYDSGRKK
ncbi:MAG: hypothetical protein ACJ8R9_06070 [Steroidobacteraceae bacterium]